MYKWHNGDHYEGDWKKGEQCGTGTYQFDNGDIFLGGWERGRKNGVGIFTVPRKNKLYMGALKIEKLKFSKLCTILVVIIVKIIFIRSFLF